jgi:hypothetical protein
MKSLFLISFLAIYAGNSFGQTDSTASNADSTVAKSSLTLGAVYSNNASYYGQSAETRIPYAAIAANYRLKSGFYFSAQTFKILNENTSSVSAGSIGAGVNFKVAKNFSTDISYNHTFYPAYSPLLQAGNADNASMVLSLEKWLTASITGDYAFGKTNDAFVTVGASKEINLFSIGAKDIVTITPSANIVAGTQHYYETYVTEKKLRDSLLGLITDPLFGNPGSTENKTVVTTSFNLLSYNFKIPLAYNRTHYVLEAEYQISALSKFAQTAPDKINSFLTFSFYYQF